MEVSIATINDPLLSDRDMAVFAGDVDVKHSAWWYPRSECHSREWRLRGQ